MGGLTTVNVTCRPQLRRSYPRAIIVGDVSDDIAVLGRLVMALMVSFRGV